MNRVAAVVSAFCLGLAAAGCETAPMAPGAEHVTFTRNPADVAACTPVGNVDHAQGAIVQNQAIGLGGNTVLDTTDSVGFALGMRAVTGVFYRCGAPAAYQSK